MIRKIFDLIFPFITNYIANKKIRKNLNCINGQLSSIDNSDAIELNVLKEQYSETLHTKDKLEDKAKSNIIAVTISITLIMGASNLLNIIYSKFPHIGFQLIIFILFIAAVLFMIIAGILSIRVIVNENIVYTVRLRSYASSEADLRRDYDICTAANRAQNLIRNNGVYTSYECIRNALICLFILLIMNIAPYTAKQGDLLQSVDIDNRYTIVYSAGAVNHIAKNNDQAIVKSIVDDAINSGEIYDSTPVGIIRKSEKLFIKAGVENHTVTVFMIENLGKCQ